MPRTIGRRTIVLGAAAAAGSAVTASTYPRSQAARSSAADLVRDMTLDEKIGQLFVVPAYGRDAHGPHPDNRAEFGVDTPAEVVRTYHPGGLVHFSWTDSLRTPRQIAELSNGTQRAALDSGAGIALLACLDQEQGAVTRIGPPAAQFPGNMALGASRSAADATRAAEVTGEELRAMGFNLNLAPSGDVNVNPANPVIGVRSFSSDPDLAAELTAAQVRGFHRAGIADSVKHFPGHGDTDVDSHTGLPVIEHDRQQWEELDAPPFRRAIAAGSDSVMSGHLLVPKLDDSGEPATLSPAVLTGMLREELGFGGVVVTDSLRMDGVRQQHPDAEIPVLALQAGADVLLMPIDLRLAIDAVRAAVRDGRLSEQRIDRSVRRVLELKRRRGALGDPFTDPDRAERFVGAAEHVRTAQEVTDRTTTLLRNDGPVLPLDPVPGSVLVTGAGGSATRALADRIAARGPRTRAQGTGRNPDQQRIDAAAGAARQHEVTVVLTSGAWEDDNAGQRDLLAALARTSRPVIAAAVEDPYDAGHDEQLPAWLATFSDKDVAVEALTRVLFGERTPRGRLPVAVPDPRRPGADRYPFGHGLGW
ncbi:glycoside hydrolase family 3 protein [Salinifilum ghardaiensis]